MAITVQHSDAYQRFISSMNIGFEQWHDGTGYDLEALTELDEDELKSVEKMLISRRDSDWRVDEALAAIGTPSAINAIKKGLESQNWKIRLNAASLLNDMGELPDMGPILSEALDHADDSSVFSRTIDLIAEHRPKSVTRKLLKMALDGPGDNAVHCVATLYYLHDLTADPFDWNHRPFFLQFNTDTRADRVGPFKTLCEQIGVKSGEYL